MLEINWTLICITCGFIVFDLITGIAKAVKNRELCSTKMKDGLFHKCGFILSIILGLLCEWASVQIDLGFAIPFLPAICGFIILTELASSLENLAEISPELAAAKFMSIFKSSKHDIDDEGAED